jgi:hypothetical protein
MMCVRSLGARARDRFFLATGGVVGSKRGGQRDRTGWSRQVGDRAPADRTSPLRWLAIALASPLVRVSMLQRRSKAVTMVDCRPKHAAMARHVQYEFNIRRAV